MKKILIFTKLKTKYIDTLKNQIRKRKKSLMDAVQNSLETASKFTNNATIYEFVGKFVRETLHTL